MFIREHFYARLRRRSIAAAREHIQLDTERQWRPDEPGPSKAAFLLQRCAYAQNDAYLELCNPGWEFQWRMGIMIFFVVMPALFVIWMWYGFAVHPLIFGKFIMFWHMVDYEPWRVNSFGTGFGWLLLFPLALGSAFMLYLLFIRNGGVTAWFTQLRGRIRFNRLTRKVYVLRPKNCGGNAVFDWDRLVCLMNPEAPDPMGEQKIKAIALYHPPFDANDLQAKGEDCIFFGPSIQIGEQESGPLWEYVRRYMEEGPTLDTVPSNPPDDFHQITRYPPPRYFTYCGAPSGQQLGLELGLGVFDQWMHMLSQLTCSWPTFPKEWNSDSALGEPEDRPVQTGAVMTALAYRADGRLSAQDEMTLMERYGTPDGIADAKARSARESDKNR